MGTCQVESESGFSATLTQYCSETQAGPAQAHTSGALHFGGPFSKEAPILGLRPYELAEHSGLMP